MKENLIFRTYLWKAQQNLVMSTLNTILKELKDVPVDRLKDLYSIIHSLNSSKKNSTINRKKILSFGGSFSDLTEKEYNDFVNKIDENRNKLFDRSSNL